MSLKLLKVARLLSAVASVAIFFLIFALTVQTPEQTSSLSSRAQLAVVKTVRPEVFEGAHDQEGAEKAPDAAAEGTAPASRDTNASAKGKEKIAQTVPVISVLPEVSIRQWAHVVEFFLQGAAIACCAIAWLVGERGIVTALRHRSARIAAIALVACVTCSLFDQTHKLFVPGREFDARDLVFDAVGYLSALAIVFGVRAIWVHFHPVVHGKHFAK